MSASSIPQKAPETIGALNYPTELLPVVTLDDDDLEWARELAEKRNLSYEEIDGGTNFAHDSEDTHLIGVLGEIAAAKFYNSEIDEKAYWAGDDGSDMIINGVDIDVKTRTHNPPILYAKTRKVHKNEVKNYVLVEQVSRREYRIWGMCTSADLAAAPAMKWPHATNHVLTDYSKLMHPYKAR